MEEGGADPRGPGPRDPRLAQGQRGIGAFSGQIKYWGGCAATALTELKQASETCVAPILPPWKPPRRSPLFLLLWTGPVGLPPFPQLQTHLHLDRAGRLPEGFPVLSPPCSFLYQHVQC